MVHKYHKSAQASGDPHGGTVSPENGNDSSQVSLDFVLGVARLSLRVIVLKDS
jgi:hypothetical protein